MIYEQKLFLWVLAAILCVPLYVMVSSVIQYQELKDYEHAAEVLMGAAFFSLWFISLYLLQLVLMAYLLLKKRALSIHYLSLLPGTLILVIMFS